MTQSNGVSGIYAKALAIGSTNGSVNTAIAINFDFDTKYGVLISHSENIR